MARAPVSRGPVISRVSPAARERAAAARARRLRPPTQAERYRRPPTQAERYRRYSRQEDNERRREERLYGPSGTIDGITITHPRSAADIPDRDPRVTRRTGPRRLESGVSAVIRGRRGRR